MNKRQLLTLGIGTLIVCWVIIAAPKYVYVPHKGSFKTTENVWYAKKFQPRTDWDWVLQRSLPVIFILGFLAFLLRAEKNSLESESHRKETDRPPKIALPKNRKHLLLILLFSVLSVTSLWIIACLIVDNIEVNKMTPSSNITPSAEILTKAAIERQKANDKINEGRIKWRSLRQGSSREQVKTILGEPLRIKADILGEEWAYPEGGTVTFETSPYLPPGLKEWSEPNWQLPAPPNIFEQMAAKEVQGDIFDKVAQKNNIPPPPEGFVLDQPNNASYVQPVGLRSFNCPNGGGLIGWGAPLKKKYTSDKIGVMVFGTDKAARRKWSDLHVGRGSFDGQIITLDSIKDEALRWQIDRALGEPKSGKYSGVLIGQDCQHYIFMKDPYDLSDIGSEVSTKANSNPPVFSKTKSDAAQSTAPVLSKEAFEDLVRQYEAQKQAESYKQKLINEQDMFYQNQLRQQQFFQEQTQKQQAEWFSQPNTGNAHIYPGYQFGQKQSQEQIQYPLKIQSQPQPIQLPNLSNSPSPVTYIKRGVDAKRIGDTTIYDDGSTAHQIGGTTIFDNGSTARQIGSTTIFDDGSTSKRIGQTTIYEDGSTSKQIGSTIIFDDGGTANVVGHSVISDK
ncbi:MAG: hypothetical protein H6753_07120 [Candidatus Omnitrophica bacterium]|nr:hypothetical protein [Candidatus Omnitrophota bacterium]